MVMEFCPIYLFAPPLCCRMPNLFESVTYNPDEVLVGRGSGQGKQETVEGFVLNHGNLNSLRVDTTPGK